MANVKTGPDIDSDREERRVFLPYQLDWIKDDSRKRIAEKSVRIGWTFCDAFKNVRKRLRHTKRDYLFASKDYPTALEYMSTCKDFLGIYNLTKSVLEHGEMNITIPVFNDDGRATSFTEEVKVGYIKFDNGSRILAFSNNPNAMQAFGGDVGLDEFSQHRQQEQLYATGQGRIRMGYDMGIWSRHFGDSTFFAALVREAQAGVGGWKHWKVTFLDAVNQGLVEMVNRTRGTNFTREEYIANAKEDSRLPEIWEQEYMCNPRGGSACIVPWEVIAANRMSYPIERLHLEGPQIAEYFGEFRPEIKEARDKKVTAFLQQAFSKALETPKKYRLGYDVAASGEGDLASIYIDSAEPTEAVLRALLTFRTEDWEFHTSAMRFFMSRLSDVRACGDETGLGRQICWTMAKLYPGKFEGVNFGREKGDLGIGLMNELTAIAKRMPAAEEHNDIPADFYAIRKTLSGSKVIFSQGVNTFNRASHCDIAWSGALASRARKVQGVPVSMSLC